MSAGEDRWLLPDGIEELLPAEAARVEDLRRDLLDLYFRWGYELVIPPLIEYTESLLIGLGKDLDLQTFTTTDQTTGRQLGIRPDITPQAARIDAHSLRRDGAVRLCYAGSVLHTRRRSPFASRSPMQIGAEFFGEASLAADIEIICLMLETLQRAGLRELTLDLGHVGIFRALMGQMALPAPVRDALFDALQDKSAARIAEIVREQSVDAAQGVVLQHLAGLHGDRSVLTEASALLADAGPDVAVGLRALEAVADAVAARVSGVTLHFDVCELHGYHYHTGLVFAAYTPGFGEAVANGGRYDDIGRVFGRARPATGFNTDLKALLLLGTPVTGAERAIFVPYALQASAWPEMQRLRAAGERVVAGVPMQTRSPGCDRELRAAPGGTWHIHSF